MKLLDIHSHLNDSRYEKDLSILLEEFKNLGGKLIITSGVNKSSNREALELSKKYELIKASFGIYPTDALAQEIKTGESTESMRELEKFDVDEELNWIEKHKSDCLAIGEIGLDYNFKEFQTEEMREKQKNVFRKCLRLAKKIDKPVIIHSRKAELDAIEILEEEKMEKVVMHCFSGKKSLIKRCIENNWCFSIPAVIKRLDHFKTLVNIVPLPLILTETDGAYLSPIVGTRNEPKNVLVTIEEIAKIKEIKKEEVSEKIYKNAKKMFRF